jgi:protein-serine/threonine kinase
MPSKDSNGGNTGGGQVSHRLRNFFRITSSSNGVSSSHGKEKEKDKDKERDKNSSNDGDNSGSGPTRPFRGTRFFSNTVGRLRSQTVASEGNQVQEALSPTAHANPYFAHQGMPGLRHHNAGSVPPSPPDTPTLKISGPDGSTGGEKATAETKEELARRLRRVASAPNAQGLFKAGDKSNQLQATNGERPATAELGKDPLIEDPNYPGSLSMLTATSEAAKAQSLGALPDDDTLSSLPLPNQGLAFRRTYSSNSIKVRTVEVNPSSFDKVKLIGKGDVGKVYLVREKKSDRLYAMKGNLRAWSFLSLFMTNKSSSVEQERNDQAKQNQASFG